MRYFQSNLSVALLLTCLVACDRAEPQTPDAPDTPAANTLVTSGTSASTGEAANEPAEDYDPSVPDDGAEKVELDESGWPAAIAPAPDDEPDDEPDENAAELAAIDLNAEPDVTVDRVEEPKAKPNDESSRRSSRRVAAKRRSRPARRSIDHGASDDGKAGLPAIDFTDDPYIDFDRIDDSKAGTRGRPTQGGGLIDWGNESPRPTKRQKFKRKKVKKAPQVDNGVTPPPWVFPHDSERQPTFTDRYSTFAVDVDTGSYALALARMRRGYPPQNKVRVEEWLNAFHYDHEVPEGQDFSILMQAGDDPLRTDRQLLRVNIAGKSVANRDRPPAPLTFVVDVSGSMFGPDKLELIRESLTFLAGQLRPDDTMAIVTFSKETGVLLWPTPATDRDKIMAALSLLEPGGSTDMEDGLKMGYAVAFRESHYNPGDIHRVVVLGDGRANVGAQQAMGMLGPVTRAVEKGITLSTFGFGAKEVNDRLLDELARRGNGYYTFIDSFKEARRVFGEQLCGNLYVIGKEAKVQVDFNLDRVASWELVGYDTRRLRDEEFRDDSADGGEIGAGHQVTAIYRFKLKPDTTGRIATTRFRWQPEADGGAREIDATLDTLASAEELGADFKFAAAVVGAANWFRTGGNSYELGYPFHKIMQVAEEGIGKDPQQTPARLEFLEVMRELEPLAELDQ
jgi:Ca-activated chloride channel family protein